jgi:uncharacterized protein YggU (UPF0235/DUF167 family)
MRQLRILVKTSASVPRVENSTEYDYLVSVKEPPIDGKANQAIIKLISEYLNIPKSLISIKSGASSKIKTIIIND